MVSNNANVDSELMKNLLVFGAAMELYYINNNTLKIKELNPLNCYVNLDAEGKVIDAIHVYKVDKEEYIEYFNSFKIYKMDKSFNIIEEKDHYFGCCPISYCSLIDGIYNTLFTDLKALQDNVENVLSDFTNEIGDSRLSYLILKNMGLDTDEVERLKDNPEAADPTVKEIAETIIGNFRDNGILLINDSKEVEAKAEYLVKSISPEIHNKLFTILQDTIYQLSQHINLNEQQSSNTSGVALMTRIIALRNKVKIQQNCMTKAIRSRLSCMFTVLNKLYGKDLDSTKVGIKYTLNVPNDDASTTDIINKLVPQGILSAETGLAQLSFINNPKQELAKAKAELEEKENMINGLISGE
ncbi:phage portal protein [Clostridium perfringens]|nr:phage portal protein [Clostridium perfringens]